MLLVLRETASNGFSNPICFQPIAPINAFRTEFLKTEAVPVMEPERNSNNNQKLPLEKNSKQNKFLSI